MGENFDVLVVGGGPGGYTAALTAAQNNLKTAIIEQSRSLGGTCLNTGCIPSKSLLHSTHLFHSLKQAHLATNEIGFDLSAMHRYRKQTVKTLSSGLSTAVRQTGIKVINDTAEVVGPKKLKLRNSGTSMTAKKAVILSPGSQPATLPFAPFDERLVLSSCGALTLPKVPEKFVVIGAGAIGLELGSVWNRLGTDVTFLEYMPSPVPGMDKQVGRTLARALKKDGMKFHFDVKVSDVRKCSNGVCVEAVDRKTGKGMRVEADKVLVSIGRKPCVDGIGNSVALEKGWIRVDEHYRTNVPGVFAIGDAVPGPMLAHKASREGHVVAQAISEGKLPNRIPLNTVPSVIYTAPEVASVGKNAGRDTVVGQATMRSNGRAQSMNAAEGFAKVVADRAGRLLGVHVVGPDAGEIIYGCVAALENHLPVGALANAVFPHPTVSEVLKEAAESCLRKLKKT